jgi:hypothetical protein
MKHMYAVFAAVLSAVALMGFGAGSAGATTLEVGGITKNEATAITASAVAGTPMVLSNTEGSIVVTECSTAHLQGTTTSPFTGFAVTAPLTALTMGGCTKAVTVHKPGSLEVVWTNGTNGDVYLSGTQITVASMFGTLSCALGAGKVKIGTLTGVSSGHATIDIDAIVSCSFLLPSIRWKGKATVTSPSGLGVSP